jgi:glycosyltransferase involved in cell wall biosynthesis
MAQNIIIISRSLEYGGAERQLVEVACGLHRLGHPVHVITFYSGGPLLPILLEAGVKVIEINKKGRWDIITFFSRLVRALHTIKPTHLYAFLGVPCIISVFLKLIFPAVKLIWGVRASGMDLSQYDWLSRISYRLECFLSVFPALIIANSHSGKEYAVSKGFPRQKMAVVPNGIDTDKFRCLRDLGKQLRKEFGVSSDEIFIGHVARLDPVKDHFTFLKAAEILSEKHNNVKFLCVGDGPDDYKNQLVDFSRSLCLSEKLFWAGARQDMVSIYNAFDLVLLSSSSEGFPNVVGEAMACGVPCVVTNVGDTAWIVGDTGVVVSSQDPIALAQGVEDLMGKLESNKMAISLTSRERICMNFGLSTMIQQTADLLEGV